MANALYDSARELFLTAGLNWTTGTIKAALVDTGAYGVVLGSHQFFAAVSGAGGVVGGANGRSSNLANRTATAGAADADNVTFQTISGNSIEAIILYRDTGDDATSDLIAYIDTATGLPITPNGGDIIVTWDNGANRIFKL